MNGIEVFLGDSVPFPEAPPTSLLARHVRHLSASSIGMLLRCPRQFQRRYIFGEKQRPGEAIVIGSIFHETLEWNYKTKIESHADQPLSDALQYLNDEAVPKILEQEGGEDNIAWDTSLDAARSDADRITAAYYQTVVPRLQPVATEERFEIHIPGVPVPVIGYVDLRVGHVMELDTTTMMVADRIIDTKTGKSVTKKVKPSWELQGRLYAQALNLPVEYHSISRAKTPSICTALESDQMTVAIPTERQAANLAGTIKASSDYLEYLLSTYGATETDWPALGAVPDFTRNMLPCDFCGWREGCPAHA